MKNVAKTRREKKHATGTPGRIPAKVDDYVFRQITEDVLASRATCGTFHVMQAMAEEAQFCARIDLRVRFLNQ